MGRLKGKKRGEKVRESLTKSWEIRKKKKELKIRERERWKWVDDMAVDVVQQKYSNNKWYALTFRDI